MTDEQQALFERAAQALDSATRLLESGDTEAAINRAYYSMHYAARALLLTQDEAPKTHQGIHNRFHFHFIAPGHLPRELGQLLGIAQEMRERADYDSFSSFGTLAAENLITDADRFVQAARDVFSG